MILVTGGTGFVGRHLVARLIAAGEEVRVLARRPREMEGAEVMSADVQDERPVREAARGCRAVVHLVGIIRERRGASSHQVHVHGTANVIRACREAGVTRLLHMSALGARGDARSRYHRSKWAAEELVRESGLEATILRPSVIFGEESDFLARLRDLLRTAPAVPVVGDGMSLVQPIWVEDVVTCFTAALTKPETSGLTYELGGAETYGFEQLVDLVAESEGLRKPKVHLPVRLMRPMMSTLGMLTDRTPITSDQIAMLLEDNTCDIRPMKETFGVDPASLRDYLLPDE